MTTTANRAEFERWNAEHQKRSWPRRERLTTEVTPLLFNALAPQPGERILDIGAGGGLAAIECARRVAPGGIVVGFDISRPLVELATERAAAAGVTNVRFVHGDAQVGDIPGGPFNAIMSQFGVMFFDDPPAAFANIARHLRPGARLTFACWQPAPQNPWFPGPVMAKYGPPPQPARNGGPPPGPFAFGDVGYVRSVLEAAGFTGVADEQIAIDLRVGEDTLFDRAMLESMRIPAERHDEAWADLQAHVAPFRQPDGTLALRIQPQIIRAAAP